MYVTMTAYNPCGTSYSTCGPVLVSQTPDPDYGFSKTTDTNCANETIYTMTNATSPCCIRVDGFQDNAVYVHWTITPPSYKLLQGNMDSIMIKFKLLRKACYTVKMNVTYQDPTCAKCGDTNITKIICTDTLPIAKFTADPLNNFNTCLLPLVVKCTNQSINAK